MKTGTRITVGVVVAGIVMFEAWVIAGLIDNGLKSIEPDKIYCIKFPIGICISKKTAQ